MNPSLKKLCIPIIGTALALGGCTNQTATESNKTGNEAGGQVQAHMHDASVIPSYNGPKTSTTNEKGLTTNGMGTTVYSLIGSSSLHDGGVSSHLQSRIAGQGIEGIQVFVMDDTVVLAREKPLISANQYDGLQNRLLSPTEGMSGKGMRGEGAGSSPAGTDDNMAKAVEQVKAMFGGNVNVLTATGPQSLVLIERIKSKLQASTAMDESVGADIAALLRMTKSK